MLNGGQNDNTIRQKQLTNHPHFSGRSIWYVHGIMRILREFFFSNMAVLKTWKSNKNIWTLLKLLLPLIQKEKSFYFVLHHLVFSIISVRHALHRFINDLIVFNDKVQLMILLTLKLYNWFIIRAHRYTKKS